MSRHSGHTYISKAKYLPKEMVEVIRVRVMAELETTSIPTKDYQ